MQEFPVRGLYTQAALLAHDCIGNTFITVDNDKQLKVYASIDIREGEIIYNNYTASLYVSFDCKAIYGTDRHTDRHTHSIDRMCGRGY